MNVLRNDLQRMAAAAEAAFRPTDPWRSKIHLAPPVGWLNDPNGLYLYYTGNVKHGGDFDYIRIGRESRYGLLIHNGIAVPNLLIVTTVSNLCHGPAPN
ncbi:hypothetical protein [uncultured Oscillibacter sp.]|uniref:hypothetical protein n=1 Tax=uncultured Oscillibacter sp. TaxID=876091 RepID=UPI0025F7907E|nr:hypothetical protein [uncultured Oscillibacter sp.]